MKYQSGRQPLLAAFFALPAARADDAALVAEAKADVQRYAGPQTQWLGPTSGPKAEPGKVVVYLSGDEQNDISRQYGVFMKQAARAADRPQARTNLSPAVPRTAAPHRTRVQCR